MKERLISAALGCMFIVVFQPFGLIAFGNRRWLMIAGICACIVISIIATEYILRWVFRKPNDVGRGMKYTVRRNIIFQITNVLLMTALTGWFLDQYCCMTELDNHWSWQNTLYIVLIYSCSSLMIGLYWRNVYMKRDFQRRLEEAQYLNGILQERHRPIEEKQLPVVEPINLTGTTKESVTLLPEDFIYAESDGNYVHIHYYANARVQETLLRCSITQIEEQLKGNTYILRCHRAFVANLNQVEKVSSQGHTLQLQMRGAMTQIPVSKTYLQTVKEKIVNPIN